MSIYDLVCMNVINAEVHRKNLDAGEGEYQPSEKDTAKQILLNQQMIMLMLVESNYGSDIVQRLQDKIEERVKYEDDRWVID